MSIDGRLFLTNYRLLFVPLTTAVLSREAFRCADIDVSVGSCVVRFSCASMSVRVNVVRDHRAETARAVHTCSTGVHFQCDYGG